MEELDLINGHRPSEIHTIIVWNAELNYEKTVTYINNLPIKNINILFQKKIKLNKDEELNLANSVYSSNISRVKNGCIYIIIIEDNNPIYSYEKATSSLQVLNVNMKIMKEDMRLKIGESKTNYHSIHTSYNQEEALLVLTPLKLTKYVKRPIFVCFSDFFDYLNKHSKLKYLVQRSFHEINQSPSFFKNNKDIDILVNDYYYF